ncbi:molecular chaperone DnaK, partial [Candidatus Uhrbacteria bacterium CG_4_9_14_3_um_filter_36_7]
DIDANGILNVSATDKATGKSQQITITASTGLSKEEIEKMKKDAELHASEDQKKKERIEHQNIADTMIYTSEKMLKEAGDKITAEERKEVEEKIENLKKVKDSDDHEAIKKAADELSIIAQKVGAKMYQGQADASTQANSDTSSSSDSDKTSSSDSKKEEPIDAEFKEKED